MANEIGRGLEVPGKDESGYTNPGKPKVHMIPPKATPSGNQSAGMGGYGEQGTENDLNTKAPYGNEKLVQSPFKQNAWQNTTKADNAGPAETSIRSVRVADLGDSFGNGPLSGGVQIAGKMTTPPKKFLPGGKAD